MTAFARNPIHRSAPQPTAHSLSVSRVILSAALVVGVLDAADGVIFLGLHGQNPIQVLQYIASSLLGARSFSGGLASAGLGLILHFAVWLVVAAIYVLESRRVPGLRSQWVLFGLLYGAVVWTGMNLVLLPHTAITHSTLTSAALANGLIGHALFVGLPSAFFAKQVDPAR